MFDTLTRLVEGKCEDCEKKGENEKGQKIRELGEEGERKREISVY